MVYVQQQSRLIGHLMENWKSSSLIANQAFEKIRERTLLGRLGGKQIHPSQCELISQDQIMFKYGGRQISIPALSCFRNSDIYHFFLNLLNRLVKFTNFICSAILPCLNGSVKTNFLSILSVTRSQSLSQNCNKKFVPAPLASACTQ